MGRTGTMWRCEAEGVTPDIMTYGKAFGGGIMPITGIICKPKMWVQDLSLIHIYMKTTGWTLVSMVPYKSVMAETMAISGVMILAVAITLIVTLLLLNRILTGVVKPLKKLEKYMVQVNPDNMDQRMEILTDDEIGHLSMKFNQMMDRIRNLKEQVIEEQEDKRKYELRALQADVYKRQGLCCSSVQDISHEVFPRNIFRWNDPMDCEP